MNKPVFSNSNVRLIVFRTTGTLNYRSYFKFGVSVRRRTVVGGARAVSGRPAERLAPRPAGRPARRSAGRPAQRLTL